MDTANLIAIDTHTHLEVSCRNPFDSYGEEYDRAADKYFRSSHRPTMDETIHELRAQGVDDVGGMHGWVLRVQAVARQSGVAGRPRPGLPPCRSRAGPAA
jgi:hypothetical protein